MPQHDVGELFETPTFRARIWSAPIKVGYTWAVDEYEITDASDLNEAINWAEREADGRPLEFFVKCFDTVTAVLDSDEVSRPWMMKLFGTSPEED